MKKVWKGLTAVGVAAAMAATGFIGATSASAATIEFSNKTASNADFAIGDRTFTVYQIMTGDVDASGNITNAKWGTAAGANAGVGVTSDEMDALKALLQGKDTDAAKASALYNKYITEDATPYGTLDKTTTKLEKVPAGWYVIVESGAVDENKGEAKSLYMFQALTAEEDLKLAPKVGTVNFEKKVKENNKTVLTDAASKVPNNTIPTDYNDVADYSIGDDVPFQLVGSIPANYDNYTTYTYEFTDSWDQGFDAPTGVTVKVDGTEVTTGFTYTKNNDGKGFSVKFDDTKKLASITANSVITVDYTMKLNSTAIVGLDGNANKATLKYSKNPNKEEIGETKTDEVVVFTYGINGTKIQQGTTNKLSGAKFILQRADGKWYKQTKDEQGNFTVDWITATDKATAVAAGATEVESNEQGNFGFSGLDHGSYTLWETKVPNANFVMPTAGFPVTINATTVNTQQYKDITDYMTANKVLTALKNGSEADSGSTSTGLVETSVSNTTSTNLPETGGMGTVVLYTVGGLIVLIAGVGLAVALRRRQA